MDSCSRDFKLYDLLGTNVFYKIQIVKNVFIFTFF